MKLAKLDIGRHMHSISGKILGVLLLGIAMPVAAALYGFGAARAGLATVGRVNDTLIAQAIQAQAVESAFKEQVQQWMSVLVRGHDATAMDKSWKQFTFREREVRRGAEKLREVVQVESARDLLDKFIKAHAGMGEKYRAGLEAYGASNFDPRKVDAQVKGIEGEPAEVLEELVRTMRDAAQAAVREAQDGANRGLGLSLGVIAITTLLALSACATLIMRTVVRPLEHAVSVVYRVAAGDLTVEVDASSRDETGRLLDGLRSMRDRLRNGVSVIRRSAESVATASRQIATGHADLSSRTEEQAASLEEAASSMEELATAVRHNTESAKAANELASGASHTAARGGEVMGDVVGTMGSISTAAREISDIVGLIDSIAFQTNIVALNAAMEVQAGETMVEIVASVSRVTQMMAEISASSQEQLTGIEQVSGVVTQMDRVVQQNASLVAESAAAAANLADHAAELLDSVAHFRMHAHEAAPDASVAAAAFVRERAERLPRSAVPPISR